MNRRSLSLSQQPQDLGDQNNDDQQGEDEWVDDEELYDDFVLLKPDFAEYNTQANLEKEREKLQSTAGDCLIGKPGTKGERITLDDFEIRKVIDKGSFGKVFLVSCQKMGKMYAMKRINKDLLL